MTPRSIIMITIPLFIIVGILSPAPAAGYRMSKTCCTRYSKKPIPSENIKGYREQVTLEHCRINAIIFYTTNNHEICTSPNDDWVKEALSSLSSKLKAMSQNTDGKKM
ncbi:PREDICTED: C-C motif chemokine 20-like [Poecilia mexicana]|uniref:C-C motif chemokine 20-like n=1 Tax=Poecilia mexicana TaxID=48701 RepID=UPI00072DD17D|nr:PREDICTED: C-C motif chemokine 20-like [Poecilia mexicana]